MLSPEILPQAITCAAIVVIYALSIPSLTASWKTKKKLNGMLRNESDCELFIACAQKSKFAAGILLMILLPAFFIVIAGVSFGIYSSKEMFFHYVGLICYSTFPIWILALIAERPLKKLKTDERVPGLEEKYQRALLEWTKPGLKIKL